MTETLQPLRCRILWTPEALIQKTKEYRRALGAELLAQVTVVREALSQDRNALPTSNIYVF